MELVPARFHKQNLGWTLPLLCCVHNLKCCTYAKGLFRRLWHSEQIRVEPIISGCVTGLRSSPIFTYSETAVKDSWKQVYTHITKGFSTMHVFKNANNWARYNRTRRFVVYTYVRILSFSMDWVGSFLTTLVFLPDSWHWSCDKANYCNRKQQS